MNNNDRTITVYQYPTCSTCRSAVKWLKEQGWNVRALDIMTETPTAEELESLIALSGLDIRKWFNVSGEVYKELQLKDKLAGMSDEEKRALLASHGKLIKRPVATDGKRVTLGFKPEHYGEIWGPGASD